MRGTAMNTAKRKRNAQGESGPDADKSGNSARRQEVIDAAANVFARFGFHGVSTRALADELGIKVASLYFHLQSKEHALVEICHRGLDEPMKFIEATLAQPRDMKARLLHYFGLMREQLHAEADYINVFIHERRHLGAEANAEITENLRLFRRKLRQLFEEAQEQGQLHPDLDPRAASLLMVGTIRNLSQLYVEGPMRDFETFMDHAVDALIRGVVAKP